MANEEEFDLRDLNVETWERAFLALGSKKMIELVQEQEIEEHPEDCDGPCLCRLCCSYGD